MAGDSARDVARRQRAKAERLERSAARWERGAEGEEATAAALAQLPTGTWTVLHDRKWPGRPYANVDHIVVGPPGVFVIDSKNWSGRVEVRDGVLRQGGRSRETSVAAAVDAGKAVAGLVPLLRPQLVHPVLCFAGEDEISGSAQDVVVCSTSNLVPMLLSRPAALAADQVAQLCLALNQGLQSAALSASDPGTGRAPELGGRGPARSRKRATASRSRRLRSPWSGLAPAIVGLGMAAVLVMRPDVVSGLGDQISGLFIDNISDTSTPEPKKQHPRKDAGRKKDATQGR